MRAFILAVCLILACGVARAEDVTTIFNGMTGKQAYIYIPQDAKSKNFTAIELARVNHIDSIGKLNLLTEGLCLDAGLVYDAIAKQTIDGGAVMIGKHLNPLLDALKISYPFKDKIDITAYVAGDSISKDGDKIVNKYALGGAYVQATVKF